MMLPLFSFTSIVQERNYINEHYLKGFNISFKEITVTVKTYFRILKLKGRNYKRSILSNQKVIEGY